jgi:hypothetical protein
MFIASLIESPFLDTRMWQKRKTQLANKERLSIANPEFAPEATYFRDPVANDLGALMAADQTVVANAPVDVLIRESGPCYRAASDCLPIKATVTTGSDGVVPLPNTVSLARAVGRIVELNSLGSKTLAPALRIFVR